jgi:hypothetical protein
MIVAKGFRGIGPDGFRDQQRRRCGRLSFGRNLCDSRIVPLKVFAGSADIEEVAGDVFELVAGEGHLKPCERKQDDKACMSTASRHTGVCTYLRLCRHNPMTVCRTPVAGWGTL